LLNQYNKIAHFYTGLSRLVFGNQLLKIQQELITHLPTDGKLLILGGGNGEILPSIFKHAPHLSIDYVEASSSMIKLAKKNAPNHQKIIFHHKDVHDYSHKHGHIYAGFFLDVFHEKQIEQLILKLEKPKKTTWYIADFQINKNTKNHLFRSMQLKLTILFFRLTTQHTINYLPNIRSVFLRLGYHEKYDIKSRSFIFNSLFMR
jgi:trans-aconitate methyltransferase